MKVSKRDGKIVDFDITKILLAISKANDSLVKKSIKLTKKQITDIVEEIGKICEDKESEINKKSKSVLNSETGEKEKVLEIEKIQDLVEDTLINNGFTILAKEYIKYRNERSRIRNQRSDFMAIIREKVSASNVKNQNANVDERSFGGRKGEADSEMLRTIALDERMSKMARENHLNNEIYTHDLDSYELGMHNCLSIPFDQLLEKGFTTRQVDIRPANSINTAFQLVAVIFQLQSLQQFGGCSATHLDWTMVPYVRKSFNKHYKTVKDIIWDPKSFFTGKESEAKEINIPNTTKIDDVLYRGKHFWNFIKRYIWLKAMRLTKKELRQAVEGMYHNLNSLQSRSGNQLPFTSINYGTCTSTEGRMVIKAILEGSIKGVGHGDTPIFPCGIFQYMKGVNARKGDPNYDLKKLAIKSTTRRLYPNYANVDWSGNAGYDINDPRTYFSTMGCRTANGFDINGFGQLKDGRGNICPVTLILPTIAMRAKLNPTKENDVVESFIELLDKKIHEAKDQLIERFDWICSQSPDSAKFMWENNVMAGYDPKEGIRSAMKHGTLAIGQIGLAETLQILIGKDHTEPEGMDLAKRIEKLFADRAKEFKEEYKLNFGVYYTPAENLCYTSYKKFVKEFGLIENVTAYKNEKGELVERGYFTNSIHVPVWKQMDPFRKIDIESQLTGYSSAGCITYVELDESAIFNEDAVEQIVDYMMDHDIPYGAINIPDNRCLDCGYHGVLTKDERCPKCGSKHVKILGRVTGYLTGDIRKSFNNGKQFEFKDRRKHSDNLCGWKKCECDMQD